MTEIKIHSATQINQTKSSQGVVWSINSNITVFTVPARLFSIINTALTPLPV